MDKSSDYSNTIYWLHDASLSGVEVIELCDDTNAIPASRMCYPIIISGGADLDLIASNRAFLEDNIPSITFKEGITKIPENFVKNCTKVTNITIPSTITEIDSNAFNGSGSTDGTLTIHIDKPENSIPGAPWGATAKNVVIEWNG